MSVRIAVVGKERANITHLLRGAELKLTNRNPEVVISAGGDGSILYAVHKYPDAAVVPVRKKSIGRKAFISYSSFVRKLRKILSGSYKIKKEMMLEACYKRKKIIALNEIQVRAKDPRKALRFDIFINSKMACRNVIADGIIMTTPFGSTAYYKSACCGHNYKKIKKGTGIVLNNPHNCKRSPKNLSEGDKIKVKINRQKALVIADNHDMMTAGPGDSVIIRKHKKYARFVVL